MKSKAYKPGQVVPVSGIYRVNHESHRLMHEATLLGQDLFPRCRQCGAAVRFRLAHAVTGGHLLPFRSTGILEEYEDAKPFKRAS